MKYNNKIHNKNHFIKAQLGNAEYLLTNLNYDVKELIVVNYHGTQKKFIPNFRRQLKLFQSIFNIISPSDIESYYSNNFSFSKKPSILLTFDDGIKNNLFAVNVLNELNIKALFFVIPDFIEIPKDEQKIFFIKNIRPTINLHVDSEQEDYSAMSWSDLKKLYNAGHSIGSHTCTHTLNAATSDLNSRSYEIEESKYKIAINLNIDSNRINSFCSPNDSLFSVQKKEMELIKKKYDYFYSTYPGSNHIDKNSYFIKRSNIECHWMTGAVINAIGKWDRKRWKSKVLAFKSTCKRI